MLLTECEEFYYFENMRLRNKLKTVNTWRGIFATRT